MSEYGVVTQPDTIRFERVLPGPIERLWAYLTESDKRATWLASGGMELRAGGMVELAFRNADLGPEAPPERFRRQARAVTMHGRVLRCEPPRLLIFTWGSEAGEPSEVTFELSPRGDDVLLVLTHRRLGERTALISVASGWHTHLAVLEGQLDRRAPQPFWSTLARVEEHYEQIL